MFVHRNLIKQLDFGEIFDRRMEFLNILNDEVETV